MHPNKMLTIIKALSDDGQKSKQQVIEVYLRCEKMTSQRRDIAVKGVFDTSSGVIDGNLAGYYRLQLCEELVYINFGSFVSAIG
jgi:hypothetical protein